MLETVAERRRSNATYWQAQGVAELALAQFGTGTTQGGRAAERQASYTLAHYYQRTRTIVRQPAWLHDGSIRGLIGFSGTA
jgi:hypothetical protein